MKSDHIHNKTFGLYKLDIVPCHIRNDEHHRLRFHSRDKFHLRHGIGYFSYTIFRLFLHSQKYNLNDL